MVEISDILRVEFLDQWLYEKPHRKNVIAPHIARRSALRAMPLYWNWFLENVDNPTRNNGLLSFLRCNLILEKTLKIPNDNIQNIIKISTRYCDDVLIEKSNLIDENRHKALAAGNAHAAVVDVAMGVNVSEYSFASHTHLEHAYIDLVTPTEYPEPSVLHFVEAEIWANIRRDIECILNKLNLDMIPLWSSDGSLQNEWQNIQTTLENKPEWQFWLNWYQAILDGTPQNQDMLRDIALIPDEVWDQGPEAVHGAISDIQLKYAVLATPNAEVISINPQTHRLRVDPLTSLSPDTLETALDKLRDVLELFDFDHGTSNQHMPIIQEWNILTKAVKEYADRPNMLFYRCTRVLRRLEIKFENGDCPSPKMDADIDDLYHSVGNVTQSLLNQDDYIKEAVTGAGKTPLPDMSQTQADILINAADEVAEISEDVLAAELSQDARDAVDESLPEAERKEAFYRTAGRLLRSWLVTGWNGTMAALEGIEKLTGTVAKIAKNVGVISGAIAGVSSPLWIKQAVTYILSLF